MADVRLPTATRGTEEWYRQVEEALRVLNANLQAATTQIGRR